MIGPICDINPPLAAYYTPRGLSVNKKFAVQARPAIHMTLLLLLRYENTFNVEPPLRAAHAGLNRLRKNA